MSVSETILQLAAKRGSDKTICPSEVARHLWPDDWRKHMEEVRDVAFRLRDEGLVQIKQKGQVTEGSNLTPLSELPLCPNHLQKSCSFTEQLV